MSGFFASFTEEWPSSWNEPDVKKWKETAQNSLKSYYLGFRGSQWDEYDVKEDQNLLLAKICFALFGPPSKGDKLDDGDDLSKGYEDEHRENAKGILEVILEVSQSI